MAGLSGRMGLHLFGEILEGGVGAQRDELSHHLGVAPTSGAVQRRVAVAVHLVQEAGARGKQPFADAQEAARGGVVLRDGQAAWAAGPGGEGTSRQAQRARAVPPFPSHASGVAPALSSSTTQPSWPGQRVCLVVANGDLQKNKRNQY